jgi:hypothetical protein
MRELMNLKELTAPCGIACFNCPAYLANDNEEIRKQLATQAQKNGILSKEAYDTAVCKGCRKEKGICPIGGIKTGSSDSCKIFKCILSKDIESCAECSDFPCDNLHPEHTRRLLLIRKMGLEKWVQGKAKNVKDSNGKWNL